MGIPNRIRNIAISQIHAIRERLDQLDTDLDYRDPVAEMEARREVAETRLDAVLTRSREELDQEAAERVAQAPPARPMSPLARHYRVLGLEDGVDLAAVDNAYSKLAARCSPDRFATGSEEEATARDILARVDAAYNALRDALNPAAGRFGKLEI